MTSAGFILAIAVSSALAHAQCYYPDGQEARRRRLQAGLGVWLVFFLRKARKDAQDSSRAVPEVESGYKEDKPAPKVEMTPVELPGYSVDSSRWRVSLSIVDPSLLRRVGC